MLTEAEKVMGPLVPAIMRGALAGALAELSRSDERVTPGLRKASDFHHAVGAAMLDKAMYSMREASGGRTVSAARAPVSKFGRAGACRS